ncbi:MAG: transposase [Kiritimatiellae bacterium]|nr:transposase [Kiritimatiellia bacterium]
MANSNGRNKEYETVHHLVSRIAHRVYFLKDSERMDFLEIARRAAEFAGIKLLGWCVMGNHFHILAFLPSPETLDEQEVLRRYGVLYGQNAVTAMQVKISRWRQEGDVGERRVEEWISGQMCRMYSIGSFMKIVKQWFTVEYNRRNAHKGTLWESAYFDRVLPQRSSEMAKCLGYIHLNPIRAAADDRFDGYTWSSYAAFRKGDPTAVAGMRFVYGTDTSVDEIAQHHEELMTTLLEEEKRRRAEEIARKRAAGYEVPSDHLTTEAMIAQSAAHIAEVQRSSMELRIARDGEYRRAEKRELCDEEVLVVLRMNPEMDVSLLAERQKISLSMAYKIVRRLKARGVLERDRRQGRWIFPNSTN